MTMIKILGGAIVAILCFAMAAVCKVVGIVLYALSIITGFVSVLIGGIGKIVGTFNFIGAIVALAFQGFSIEVLVMFGASILLITSGLWLKKLSYLLSDISAAI